MVVLLGSKPDDIPTRSGVMFMIFKAASVKRPDYPSMHSIFQNVQKMLETKYGVTLGYQFNDSSVYSTWDKKLQDDIERHDAVSKDIVISGEWPERLECLSEGAEFVLNMGDAKFGLCHRLEEKFGKNFYDDIKACL